MKYILSSLFLCMLLFTSCEKEALNSCEAHLQAEYACPRNYDPVCGCNNVTYSNDCVAESFGIIEYTDGPCPN